MKYKFFYDESNNIRRMYIKEAGYNIDSDPNQPPPANFVLGGICHHMDVTPSSPEHLRGALNIQDSSPEIKLKHIAKGGFLDLLKSDKLSIVLKWLNDSEYFLHFKALNFIYWSYVDIIDDIYCYLVENNLSPRKVFDLSRTDNRVWLDNYKNSIYFLVLIDKVEFISVLKKFEYPFVKKEVCRKFIRELNKYAKRYLNDFSLQKKYNLSKSDIEKVRELTYLLDSAKDICNLNLTFMSEPDILIDSLGFSYYNAIISFDDSVHIFDHEYEIEDNLVSSGNLEKYNFEFVDSINNIEVQLSDVFSGLLSKYFEFLSNNSFEQIEEQKNSLNDKQKDNLFILKSIFQKSYNEDENFLFRVFPAEQNNKHDYFMFEQKNKRIIFR